MLYLTMMLFKDVYCRVIKWCVLLMWLLGVHTFMVKPI